MKPVGDTQAALIAMGEKIKQARCAKNLSQAEIAREIGTDKGKISRLEAGKANPTVQTLIKLSKALDVPVHFFFSE